MEKDLGEAVKKDLGRDYFTTWFTEFAVIDNEIEHTISHLNKWS
jgi:hypothetical protein